MVPITDSVAEEAAATPVALPNVRALSPRFGADCIWYLSSDGGVNGLWRFGNGTAHEIWKPGDRGLAAPPALSADGKLISFLVRRQKRRQLYVMSTDGTNVRALAETLEVRDAPTWSSDGKWIGVATGEQLLKVPADGGPPVLLVEGAARLPIWSPDGRFILYSESIQGGPGYPVKAITPAGEPFPLPPIAVRRSGDRYRVLPNGRQVVFVTGDYGRQDFWLVDLESGVRRKLTNLQPGFSIQGFDISPDGTRILFDRFQEQSDIVLIDLPPSPETREP